MFAAVYMKLGQNDISNKYVTGPKAYRFEICEPSLRFVVTYMRMVRTQTSTRVSLYQSSNQDKSDPSHVNAKK